MTTTPRRLNRSLAAICTNRCLGRTAATPRHGRWSRAAEDRADTMCRRGGRPRYQRSQSAPMESRVMAKTMVEVLVDDLDGSEAMESVRIGWNGQWRELESLREEPGGAVEVVRRSAVARQDDATGLRPAGGSQAPADSDEVIDSLGVRRMCESQHDPGPEPVNVCRPLDGGSAKPADLGLGFVGSGPFPADIPLERYRAPAEHRTPGRTGGSRVPRSGRNPKACVHSAYVRLPRTYRLRDRVLDDTLGRAVMRPAASGDRSCRAWGTGQIRASGEELAGVPAGLELTARTAVSAPVGILYPPDDWVAKALD